MSKKWAFITFAFFQLAFCLQASAELWKCSNGVYRSSPPQGESCELVKVGVKCKEGERIIGSGVNSSPSVCPRVKLQPVRDQGITYASRDLLAVPFEPEPSEQAKPKIKRGYAVPRGHTPVTDQLMNESLSIGKVDWESATKDVDEGRDPFPEMNMP